MKKIIILILPFALLFGSCKKENLSDFNSPAFLTANEPLTIRYEFSADHPATYKFVTETNDISVVEHKNTTDYKRVVTSPEGPTTAHFIVYAPEAWQFSGESANITMKIIINDREYARKSAVLRGGDRDAGERLTAQFK